MEDDGPGGAGRAPGAGRGSRLGSLASDVPSSRLGKLRVGLGVRPSPCLPLQTCTDSAHAQDVVLRPAAADGFTSDAAAAGGALSSVPKPGQSRLVGVSGTLAAAAGAPGASPPSLQPRKPQFVPKVPVDRPRAAAVRDAGGQRGSTAAAPDATPSGREHQELIRQTQADAARLEARKLSGRGRGRGIGADAGPSAAALAPPVTLGTAASPAPRAASAPAGDEKPSRRGRPARAAEEPRGAVLPVPMELSDDDDEGLEHKPRDLNGWLDTQRYFPTVLPFAAPPEDSGALPSAGSSPLADLGLTDGTPDGRLFLVQLPVRHRDRMARRVASRRLLTDPRWLQALVPVVATASGSKPVGGATAAGGRNVPLPLEALDDGLLGQLIVYASGAAKLRVGDVMFDVMAGAALTHNEQVAALNSGQERCGFLGAVASRVVITPDVDSLLAAV